jgi:UPF0755 protein
MKKLWGVFLALLLIPGGMGAALLYLNRPPEPLRIAGADGVVFRVLRGETVSGIAGRLEREGVVRSALLLRLFSRVRGTETAFQSGTFRVPAGSTAVDVHNLLVAGYQDIVRVTIPEGWTISRIGRRLEELEITTAEEFRRAAGSPELREKHRIPGPTLEGYLFPDTYFMPKGYPAPAVAEQMVENFFKKLAGVVPEHDSLDPKLLYERVVLASIVEREYRVAEEAPRIASVFYNRLKYNIGLESCATLAYIITEIQGRGHPDYITREDKKIDSSFNTYKWAGLPPGPIANPGLVALDAVFRPARTNFYYFVLKDPKAGRHYFSTDLSEHNEAKYQYLKR